MNGRAGLTVCALALVLTLPAVTACSLSPVGTGVSDAVRSQTFRVSGSGTCLPLLRLLTKSYKDPSASFVYLPGLHSKGGIAGVKQGDLEIGAVSRDLTADEKAGLRYTLLSNDALVMATNPGIQIKGLTKAQVIGIYTGKYTDWSQVGGPKQRIVVLDRNEDESAKIILREYVLGSPAKSKVTTSAVKLYYEPDMVEGLIATPGSIGYLSLGLAISEKLPIHLLELDGATASVQSVESGAYAVIRPLGVVTVPAPGPKADAFLKWATGPDAASIMRKNGYSPAKH